MRDLKAKKAADHAASRPFSHGQHQCRCCLRASNERAARRQAALQAAHAAEFEDLLARGENPYKVFREREVAAAAAKAERRARLWRRAKLR
jgi:hypothetical protein